MKMLVIGDFHGKFPEKLKKIAKGKDIDLVVSVGDYCNIDKIRKYIFKYWTEKKWYNIIGLKKAKKIEEESFYSGLKILRELNEINKKIYTIWGNADFYKGFITKKDPLFPGYFEDKIKQLKNIIVVDKQKKKIENLDLIGFGGYLDVTEYIKHPIQNDKKKQAKTVERYKKSEKMLNKLFLTNNPKKPFIFLIHYTPYGIFDKVKFKGSPMNGKHVGFEPYNKIIKKYKPLLVLCGHMHEYQGMKNLYGVPVINPGAAVDGKAAIVEIDEEKGRIKNVKFY